MNYNLENLRIDTKKALIDYLHGMPKDLTTCVKLHINDPYMDPSIYNSNTRKLSQYSNIAKYMNKNVNIEYVNNPELSDYQSEYSKISKLIDDTCDKAIDRVLLKSILDSESYNIDSIRKIEEYMIDKEFNEDIKSIILYNIFPYKLKVYEIYNILLYPELNYNNANQLINTYNDILDYINTSDITSLSYSLYRYFKIINLSNIKIIPALDRFPIHINDVERVKDYVKLLIDKGTGVMGTYSNDFKHKNITDTEDTLDNSNDNEFIFTIPNINNQDKEIIINNIKTLDKTKNEHCMFDIDDDTYAELRKSNVIKYVGNIYRSNNTNYHIIEYNGVLYLVGLSIPSINNGVYKELVGIPILDTTDNIPSIYLDIPKNKYEILIPY